MITPRYVFLDFTVVLTFPEVVTENDIDTTQASSVVCAALAEALEIDPDSVTTDKIYLSNSSSATENVRGGLRQLTGSSSNLNAESTITLRVHQSDIVASGGSLKDAATKFLVTTSDKLSTSYTSGNLSQLIQAHATSGSILSDAQVNKALSNTPSTLHYGYTADRSQALDAQPASDHNNNKGTHTAVSIVVGVFLSIAAMSAIFGYVYYKRPPLCVRMLHDTGILSIQK